MAWSAVGVDTKTRVSAVRCEILLGSKAVVREVAVEVGFTVGIGIIATVCVIASASLATGGCIVLNGGLTVA